MWDGVCQRPSTRDDEKKSQHSTKTYLPQPQVRDDHGLPVPVEHRPREQDGEHRGPPPAGGGHGGRGPRAGRRRPGGEGVGAGQGEAGVAVVRTAW